VQLPEIRRYVVTPSSAGDQTCGGVLDKWSPVCCRSNAGPQDRESSPVKDQLSTTLSRNQHGRGVQCNYKQFCIVLTRVEFLAYMYHLTLNVYTQWHSTLKKWTTIKQNRKKWLLINAAFYWKQGQSVTSSTTIAKKRSHIISHVFCINAEHLVMIRNVSLTIHCSSPRLTRCLYQVAYICN